MVGAFPLIPGPQSPMAVEGAKEAGSIFQHLSQFTHDNTSPEKVRALNVIFWFFVVFILTWITFLITHYFGGFVKNACSAVAWCRRGGGPVPATPTPPVTVIFSGPLKVEADVKVSGVVSHKLSGIHEHSPLNTENSVAEPSSD